MTQEEKARRYDKVIEVMRNCETDKYGCVIGVKPSDLFPELIESEDEESKKWIMEYLYDGMRHSDEQYKSQFESAIAWLEKQGGQKPSDKLEPKFHKGDWVVMESKELDRMLGAILVLWLIACVLYWVKF